MKIPTAIRVTVIAEGAPMLLADILVSCQFYRSGQPFYETQIGLTDPDGRVRITADRIQESFDLDQRLFPMDYKGSLPDCDPMVDVIVLGEDEFRQLRDSIARSSLAKPEARAAMAHARNESIVSAAARVTLDDDKIGDVTVGLPVRAAPTARRSV
jgi:hypothetical protein